MLLAYGILPSISFPVPARANVYDAFGAGARSQGLAGATTATSNDFTAAWHNPAGLIHAPDAIGVGLVAGVDRTAIALSPRPAGYDPPGYADRLRPRADTDGPSSLTGFMTGASFAVLSDDLRAGAVLYLPVSGISHGATWFGDEREQFFSNRLHFELIEERLQSEVIAGGLAYRPAPWIAVGIGTTILPISESVASVYTPNATHPETVWINTRIEQTVVRALSAGAIVEPLDGLRVAFSFQDESFFRVHGHNEVQIAGQENVADDPIVQPLELLVHMTPPRFRTGLAWVRNGISASVDTSYTVWSRYRGSHGEDVGFEDALDVRAGLELARTSGTFLRFGAGFIASPVPPQTGRTNYVDNNRLLLASGAGRRFSMWDQVFQVDFAVQLHALLPAQTKKQTIGGPHPLCADGITALCDELADQTADGPVYRAAETRGLQTGNPGFPGWTSGGYLLTSAVDVKWLF